MKIVIVSDSHGNYSLLNQIVNENYDADYFFHLGDFEIPESLMSPFCFIKGNCDFSSSAPTEKNIIINNLKFHLEHGDKINYMYFDEYIKNKNCDIFLFGHIHKKMALEIYNTKVFNPGSLTRPRDSSKGSYLILFIDKNNRITYEFKELK